MFNSLKKLIIAGLIAVSVTGNCNAQDSAQDSSRNIFLLGPGALIGLLTTASIPAITLGLIYKKFKTEKAKPGNENLTFKDFIKKSAACKKALIAAGAATPVFGVAAVPLFAIVGFLVTTMFFAPLYCLLCDRFIDQKNLS